MDGWLEKRKKDVHKSIVDGNNVDVSCVFEAFVVDVAWNMALGTRGAECGRDADDEAFALE